MENSIIVREEENLEQMLSFASKAGFKEVMLGFGSSELFKNDFYEKEVERIQKLLCKYDLKCGQTHLPYYHLTVSSEIKNESMEMQIKRAIQASAMLGAQWTAYHPRTDVTNGFNRTKSKEANISILKDYLETAEKYGIGIAVENMPLYPYERPDWKFFGGGWEELCEVCNALDSDKIGICWDFGHAHTANLDQIAAINEVGSLLKMTHVHDNYRKGDHHQLPLLASVEWNSIHWDKVMQALRNIDYQGSLTLELIYPPLPMCETFIKLAYECLEYLKQL